ncbi:MAG TPA: helix-turn-helix domain-containing protein [Clostridiales bacterium]|nr:helix-turn-helix domain-containing protein [Clostridiales bacterium]
MDNYKRKDSVLVKVLNNQKLTEHFQQNIQLFYIIEGRMDIKVGEQQSHLKADDILIINANKKYSFEASVDILYALFEIDYGLINTVFQSVNIIFWCNSTISDGESYDKLRGVIKQLLNHYLGIQKGMASFGYISLCYQMIDILTVHFLVQESSKDNADEKDKFEERLMQINNYIRANYNQSISLKELSEKLYLSTAYLSRFFKRSYGMKFTEYLTNIRLNYAIDELLYTNNPVTKIAFNNGFTSLAVFNKAFKKTYGETPSAVRKKSKKQINKEENKENIEVIEERLEQFLREDGIEREKEKSEKIQMEYSAENSTLIKPFWNKMINGGSAEDMLQSEVREHMILLKEALGFQYVRFWNIFSPKLLIDITSEGQEYNFSRLDSILDFLLLQGIKPHIELGQKPRRIHKTVQSALVYEDTGVRFHSLKQWDGVIHALMSHLIDRYGAGELDTWRMELWYDERYYKGDSAIGSYFELFNHTYKIIRKYTAKLEIGGCGLEALAVTGSNSEFLKEWMFHQKPDFISGLNYAYIRGKEKLDQYSLRVADSEFLLHSIEELKREMAEVGMTDIKLYLTEWNLSISDRNAINDTCFKGAYIVKNILDVYGKVDEIGYFLGSDRVSEYYDSNTLLNGGMGLLTKDGIMKPAAFAFEFLNQLYPYFIGRGENYLITADLHQTYGIVCHNQKRLNYNYFLTREDEIEKKNDWKYYEDRDMLEICIKLKNLENGIYRMQTYRINEQCGSVLNIWREMDYDRALSRNDIQYFRRVCEPKNTIQKYKIENGTGEIVIQMHANEIAYIRLSKQM